MMGSRQCSLDEPAGLHQRRPIRNNQPEAAPGLPMLGCFAGFRMQALTGTC